jgi:hypothetical protein
MRGLCHPWVLVGVVSLVVSCGGGGGQTTDGGTGGTHGGTGGTGGAGGAGKGGAGGQAAGTGGSSASCANVAPCGGNIVGTWKVSQSCVTATEDFSSAGAGCTGAAAVLGIAYGGSVTFKADQTYDFSTITATETVQEHFPSGCSPFGLTCQQLGQTATDGGPSRCSTDTQGGCSCDSVMMLTSNNPAGTYAVSGSTLTTSSTSGMPSTSSFCVQGSLLYWIFDQTADAGLVARGGLVLAKQ